MINRLRAMGPFLNSIMQFIVHTKLQDFSFNHPEKAWVITDVNLPNICLTKHMVSYCDQSLSVVRRPSCVVRRSTSTICLKS